MLKDKEWLGQSKKFEDAELQSIQSIIGWRFVQMQREFELELNVSKATISRYLQIVIGAEKWIYYDNSKRKACVDPVQPHLKRDINCQKVQNAMYLVRSERSV